MKLFVAPHNDDAVLFGAFTLMRERPKVLTVFDSFVQVRRGFDACNMYARRAEDVLAICGVLGCDLADFGGVRDDLPYSAAEGDVEAVLRNYEPSEVWLPAIETGGHAQHNLVSRAGLRVFGGASAIHWYYTYTDAGKTTDGVEVSLTGEMLRRKWQALSCYRTQMDIADLGCLPHFARDLREFVAA